VGSNISPVNFAISLQIQMASQQEALTAMYSTSAGLIAIEPCFLLNQEITLEPKLKQHPEVLFLLSSPPAQSESTNPCIIISPPLAYLRP
jgi:hypothetical protein